MKKLFTVAIVETLLGLILFGSAGRIDLPWIWVLLGIHTLMMTALQFVLPCKLLSERWRPGGRGEDRPYRIALVIVILASLVIMGLDAGRFGWTPAPALWVRLAGLLVYVLGVSLSLWSMFTNPFFSSVVRIQSDRGHVVVSQGPYGWVRHPGYTGMMLAMLAQCAMAGSAWAIVPSVIAVGIITFRARFEERLLCAKLDGYSAYADRVRWRFAPGVA